MDISTSLEKHFSNMTPLTWIEISRDNLTKNIQTLRERIGEDVILAPCIKGNAYGHGLLETGKHFLESGADWLTVNALYEAKALRENGINSPILIIGYVSLEDLMEAVQLNCKILVYNKETIQKLGEVAEENNTTVDVHIKVETGNNRQGVHIDDLVEFVEHIQSFPKINLEGISTHFANIEDTTDHSYAKKQLEIFHKAIQVLEARGINTQYKHCANSAATILLQNTHFNLVRPGIASYGMWPSNETYISHVKENKNNFPLSPALTWKAKIAQIKEIDSGEYIGYGCTYKTTHKTKIAIIPIGYYDGYDRGIKDGYVLIHDKRAYIRGRICMNIIMVEVTDISEAKLEDEVVLLGQSGNEEITPELLASWAGTINYEITTRINERIPRIFV
jgi:alanine racemase